MMVQLRHKLVWYGAKRLNFKARSVDMSQFVKDDGSVADVRVGKVDGIVFGYMVELGNDLLVFKVQDVLLKTPVRVNWNRVLPDGSGPSPTGKRIDEVHARRLLADVIAKNSSQRHALRNCYGLIREPSARQLSNKRLNLPGAAE